MSVIVRAHDSGGAVQLIEHALSASAGLSENANYVAVGDTIDVDEQVDGSAWHAQRRTADRDGSCLSPCT